MEFSIRLPTASCRSQGSEYGSEFDSDAEEQLASLMDNLTLPKSPASHQAQPLVIQSVETNAHQQHGSFKRRPRLSASSSGQEAQVELLHTDQTLLPSRADEVEYDGDDLFDNLESFRESCLDAAI